MGAKSCPTRSANCVSPSSSLRTTCGWSTTTSWDRDKSAGAASDVACLNRIFQWCHDTDKQRKALDVVVDARQADIILSHLGLKKAPGAVLMEVAVQC